jgi:hypothetical protein
VSPEFFNERNVPVPKGLNQTPIEKDPYEFVLISAAELHRIEGDGAGAEFLKYSPWSSTLK